jgi:hypothetical protein
VAAHHRPEGATVAQIAEATGWAQHTVRGFFAGLKKTSHAVEVLQRVRPWCTDGPGGVPDVGLDWGLAPTCQRGRPAYHSKPMSTAGITS